MFDFLRGSSPKRVSGTMFRAIQKHGLPWAITDASMLRMVESAGRFSDRKVTYFRVFDPAVATQRSLNVKRYRDLDAFPGLVMQSGHVEHDGSIFLSRPTPVRIAGTPTRTSADRTGHDDDSHLVFHGDRAAAGDPTAVETPQTLRSAETS